jgi:acetolactate synthase-1/2/3 large subunit
VLLLSGDGSAGFTLAEIETALRFGTPYVAVIACDDAWGIEADSRPPEKRQATTLGPVRFDRVAEAIGARGVFIETPSQIGPAVAEGLAASTVTIIHVPTQLAGIAAYEAGRIG